MSKKPKTLLAPAKQQAASVSTDKIYDPLVEVVVVVRGSPPMTARRVALGFRYDQTLHSSHHATTVIDGDLLTDKADIHILFYGGNKN
uniref:BTB_2 domain-containing protein n=1 Tax=Panagrellus redivivus TaxID=6233 RepID=A0A7E4WBG1_PANRE